MSSQLRPLPDDFQPDFTDGPDNTFVCKHDDGDFHFEILLHKGRTQEDADLWKLTARNACWQAKECHRLGIKLKV